MLILCNPIKNTIMDRSYKQTQAEVPHASEPMAAYGRAASRTIFNKAQIELLDTMASVESDEELMALKHAISEFYARRADEEMERLWQSGEWNEQTLEDLRSAHYRTPYKQ